MEEKEKLRMAQDWVRQLANGINPLNGNAVNESDIVNNVHISRCLFYVADILGTYSEKKPKPSSLKNTPFISSAVQIAGYNYTDAISLSAFAKEIEKLIPENMKTISYKSMVTWLLQEGLLIESDPYRDGRIYKIASEKGNRIGIYSEDRERTSGHYLVTLYNREAQRFLLEHLEVMSRIK